MRGRGVVSILFWLLSWAALDDITTDTANEFPVEYTLLLLAGLWFAGLGVSLIAARRWFTGVFSLVAVAVGVVAFWSLPHHYGPLSFVNYFGFIPVLWFLGLAVWLIAARRRPATLVTT